MIVWCLRSMRLPEGPAASSGVGTQALYGGRNGRLPRQGASDQGHGKQEIPRRQTSPGDTPRKRSDFRTLRWAGRYCSGRDPGVKGRFRSLQTGGGSRDRHPRCVQNGAGEVTSQRREALETEDEKRAGRREPRRPRLLFYGERLPSEKSAPGARAVARARVSLVKSASTSKSRSRRASCGSSTV